MIGSNWYKKIKTWLIGFAVVVTGTGIAMAQQPDFVDMPKQAAIKMETSVPNAGKAEVVVSDKRPEATLKKWNSEAKMKVSVPSVSGQGRRKGDTFRYGQGNEQVRMKDLDDGFKIDMEWQSEPQDNEVTFQLENTENLNFYYQPPLDEAYPDENCTATKCIGKDVTFTERPENVVGSYAVYHKKNRGHVKGDTNYATGKAYHIYRPKIIDDAGNETWGELRYSDGRLIVTVPQRFLDRAVYPVIVDPTFGYETVGGSSSSVDSDIISGTLGTLSEDGDVSKLTAYFKSYANGNVRGAIYNKDGTYTGNETNELSTLSTGVWTDFNFSSDVSLTAADYYLSFWSDTDNNSIAADGNVSAIHQFEPGISNTYSNWPDFDGQDNSESIKSIYATYTASAGAAPVQSGPIIIQ